MGNSSPTECWQRYRGGDPDAARALFDHYSQRLCRLAEQHLSRRLAGRVDGEDVVQSALRSFFLRAAGGEFQIDSRGQLWPEDAVIVLDQIESLLQGLPELHGTVLQFRLQGHSVAEIAEQLGITRQAVYRALELLQHRLARNS